MSRIAIIGAGIAGLTVATELQAAGHAVTLFEKSRGPGGRCATRRSAAGPFDHGAPQFSATTAAFREQVLAWRDAGWVAQDDEQARAAGAADATGHDSLPGPSHGVPSMNALPRQVAAALPAGALCAEHHVAAIEPGAGGAGWRLRLLDGSLLPAAFDAVVVAVPVEQAAVLLAPDSALAQAAQRTLSDPCWTVMAAWADPLPALAVDRPNRRVADPHRVLSHVHRDDVRSGRVAVDGIDSRWVLHATPSWTREHLDTPPDQVIAMVTGAWAVQLGTRLAAPVHAAAHRWRYAQVPDPLREPFGWNDTLRLGACGDAWHATGVGSDAGADGVERAWLSARALADAMRRTLPRP